ncbi:Protein kti12 [Neofusicoccum parvum]|uniref:Protein kti12 n=1 Tax=Neofusicoccum parvum TaxID=310453 RepID=A0ACB5S0P9_9PEZI|nr:Protein kti12 [Neofusicoccum parvum]GME48172.1 Protein kti12 [Neofusicoccum parvum]
MEHSCAPGIWLLGKKSPLPPTNRKPEQRTSPLPAMPLVLISGYPSAGKTHRALQLLDFFRGKIASAAPTDARIARLKVHHINDQTLGLARDVYHTARAEKDARAAEASAVKRVLGRDDIVIADGMNYIKGFRYQLYCEAKAMQTPSCVVHVGTSVDKCREINTRLLADPNTDGGYVEEDFENLVFRYEEPNGMTRWDSPLFTVVYDDETPPFDQIWDAMVGNDGKAKVVRPNAATVLRPATEQNYLYELDKTTSDIVSHIVSWQKDHPGEDGGEVTIPDAENAVELPASPVSLPQLQRIRRQFITLNRQHNLPKARVRDLFVDYLNDAFQAS